QTAFAHLGYRKGDFPVSEDCASRIFSLPMHPYLKPEDQEKIVKVLKK
ncbi:MAG: DegT/DnrJ/EryC1/StrS family aminotransferase, partial [Syntrophales bacterium LBB04]|nr:DegT/DnrJ/EryC1/StrS family aminotransferase [Syntrophales bacterium LBB04]